MDDSTERSPKLWDKHLQSISGDIEYTTQRNNGKVTCILPLEKSAEVQEVNSAALLAVASVPGSENTHEGSMKEDLKYMIDNYKPTILVCLTEVEKLEQHQTDNFLDHIPKLHEEHAIQVLFFPLAENCFTSPTDIETLKILSSEISTAYSNNASVVIFCGPSETRSCVIIACVLLELRITRTIEESVQILRKLRSPNCITTEHLPILQKFELSFYKRLPSKFIEQCEKIIANEAKQENSGTSASEVTEEALGKELQTFYKLNLLETHRDNLWKHTNEIIKILSFPSENIQFLASQSLRQLTLHKRTKQEIKENNGIEQISNALEHTKSELTAELLISTITQVIMDSKEAALMFGELGVVSSIIEYLGASYANHDVQKSACSCLLMLSSYRGQLQTIIHAANSFPKLLALLDSPLDKIIVHTCDIIQNLCIDNDENRKAFCAVEAAGYFTRAISSISANNPLRLILLQTLKTICGHTEEIQNSFGNAGVVELCIDLLSNGSQVGPNDIQTCEYTSNMLKELSTRNENNQKRILNSNGVPVLINLLQTVKGHEIIIGNTLDCISSMTEINLDIIEVFLQHGLLQLLTPHFFQMLASNLKTNPASEVSLVNALGIVSHMTLESTPAQKEFREVQSIGIILHFLKPGVSASIQQSAARVITALCFNNDMNTQLVINEHGLESLVDLLHSEDAALLDCCLDAIATILEENRECYHILGDRTEISLLVSILSSGAWQLRTKAAICLTLLANHEENSYKQTMIKCGIIPQLINCLSQRAKKLIAQVAFSISVLVDEKRNQNDFRKAGVIPALVAHLDEETYFTASGKVCKNIDIVKIAVTEAIIALCRDNAANVDAMIKARGLDKLVILVHTTNEELLLRVLELLWVVAGTEGYIQGSKYQNAIKSADKKKSIISLFSVIPKLLLHYEERIALNATGLMCSLSTKNKKITALFLEHDAQEMLASMPTTSNVSLREQMEKAKEIFVAK